jgi:hypothetical protein
MRSLATCGLRRTQTAAEPLDRIAQIPGVRSGRPTPIAEAQLRAYMEPVLSTLYSEAGEIQMAAINTATGKPFLQRSLIITTSLVASLTNVR